MKIDSLLHRRYVASLPCLLNGYWDETLVPHHLMRAQAVRGQKKVCDSLCVPLSHFNHDMLHRNGNEVVFFINNGWDYLDVLFYIRDINSKSPDKRIREATAVEDAIIFYEGLRK